MTTISTAAMIIGAIIIFMLGSFVGVSAMALMNIAKDADRHIKCHAECERYKQWTDKLEAIKHEREKSLAYTRYLADKAKKHKTKGCDQYEKQYGKRRHK